MVAVFLAKSFLDSHRTSTGGHVCFTWLLEWTISVIVSWSSFGTSALTRNILLRWGKLSGYLISLLDQNSTREPEAFLKFFLRGGALPRKRDATKPFFAANCRSWKEKPLWHARVFLKMRKLKSCDHLKHLNDSLNSSRRDSVTPYMTAARKVILFMYNFHLWNENIHKMTWLFRLW